MIDQPFEPRAAELNAVDTFGQLPENEQTSQFWERGEATPFRSAAKNHYRAVQDNRCCYCQKQMDVDHGRVWDVEHILCRDNFPMYMFEPVNLALACPDCNGYKSTKPVSKSAEYVNFPSKSNSYTIVHPHLDEFDDHIGVIAETLYYAKSESLKGQNTIRVCNLMRFGQKFDRRKGNVCDKRYESDVTQLLFAKDLPTAMAAVKKLLTVFEKDIEV